MLLFLPACNLTQPIAGPTSLPANTQPSQPSQSNSSPTPRSSNEITQSPSNPWEPGQELFPGEYVLLPEQDLVPIELSKIPQKVTTPICANGCNDMVSLLPNYWAQDYYTSSLPYEFWPEMGKQYSNNPIKTKIKFSVGIATRGDDLLQQQFAGIDTSEYIPSNNTTGPMGLRVIGKDYQQVESNGIILYKGINYLYKDEPTPYTDQFSINVDWDTLDKDSENIDFSKNGLQLTDICMDFYFKPNEEFFHRACQPILRNPKEGRFQIGVNIPKDISSVWVAVRPFIDESSASDLTNVYHFDDVYGVWLVNLQDVTPTSMGSIDVTCKNMNCLPAGSIAEGKNSNQFPIPVFCPGETFMGSTFSAPVTFIGGKFGRTDVFGYKNLWTDVAPLKPNYYITGSAINLAPGNTNIPATNHDTVGAFGYEVSSMSITDKNVIDYNNNPVAGVQLDRAMKYGLIYGFSWDKLDIKNGLQIWSYSVSRYSTPSSGPYNMFVAWRYQCSK